MGATMLNNSEKLELSKIVMATAKYYDKALDADVVRMIVEDLSDISFEQIAKAFFEYRRNPKNKFWPKSSDIRAIVYPQADNREIAITLAYKIDKSIRDHGYNWAIGQFQGGEIYYKGGKTLHHTFKDAVIAELGPLGWHAICSRGGWLAVRNSANEMDEGIFIAQMRDQIQASYSLEKQGVDITRIEMPDNRKIESNDLLNVIGFRSRELRNGDKP